MATPDRHPAEDMPVYWFAVLERAVQEGDFEAAAHAQAELERLGVTVRYRRRPARERREAAHA
jgi:hypothetical protein